MGADLIGYIVKGPAKLPKNAVKLAIKSLKAQRKRLIAGVKECEVCGQDMVEGETCSCGWPVIEKDTTDEAISELAKELVNEWPPTYRDCCSRQDPDDPKQVIVFAGDMSWGDEPENAGYQYLKKLINSGIGEVLKIR